jgi:hypothetical protein
MHDQAVMLGAACGSELRAEIGNGNNQYTQGGGVDFGTGEEGVSDSDQEAMDEQGEPNAVESTGDASGEMASELNIYYVNGNTVVEMVGEAQNAEPITFKGKVDSKDVLTGYKNEMKGAARGSDKPRVTLTNKEKDMTKCEITKYLETATPAQLEALSAIIQPPTPEALKAAADKIAADEKAAADLKAADDKAAADLKAAEAAKHAHVPTFDELLATATPEMRDSLAEGLRIGKEKKAATVKLLLESKRCDMTDAELTAMSQVDLDKLVKLADIKTAAVDFSGLGQPRVDAPKDVPPAPDINARILAANKK